jgi:hypothetical protein
MTVNNQTQVLPAVLVRPYPAQIGSPTLVGLISTRGQRFDSGSKARYFGLGAPTWLLRKPPVNPSVASQPAIGQARGLRYDLVVHKISNINDDLRFAVQRLISFSNSVLITYPAADSTAAGKYWVITRFA